MRRLHRRMLLRLTTLAGAAEVGLTLLPTACGVLPVRAPSKVPRIGYLSPGPREAQAQNVVAFLEGLRDLSYIEGQTIGIEWRFSPGGTEARFDELAADLARLPVDVIVAATTRPALAARQATNTIPNIALNVANPVAYPAYSLTETTWRRVSLCPMAATFWPHSAAPACTSTKSSRCQTK